MATQISQYVDPGVYQREVIVPGALNVATLPVLPTAIAHGSRLKRATNEALVRGLVTGEALTLSGSSPYVATLANRGDRRVANTTVYADGVPLADAFVSYRPATLASVDMTAGINLSTTDAFALSLDGKVAITIVMADTAVAGTLTVTQQGEAQFTVDVQVNNVETDFSAADLANAINAALAAATDAALGVSTGSGYGASYGAVATVASNIVTITSPTSGPSSQVKVLPPASATRNAVTALFGATTQSSVVIQVADAAYDAAASYTVDYVSLTDYIDTPAQVGVQDFIRVGAFSGVSTFSENVDFENASGTLDWSNATATGVITSATTTGEAQPFDVNPNTTLRLSVDGKPSIDIVLTGLLPAPVGYADPSNANAATAAELVANINAVLANSGEYGAAYRAVASVSGTSIKLTSPNDGTSSSIVIGHPATLDASAELFGLAPTQTLTVLGTGTRPDFGAQYYATYEFTRPAGDYNAFKQFFTLDQALAFTGPISADNPLSIAAELAFRNGSPSVAMIQVNDSTAPGSPTRLEYQAALDIAETRSTATDITVFSTSSDVQTDLVQHVEDQSGPVAKNFRRGWFGVARSTPIGDTDTSGSMVYLASRTLQVSADSPARGRLILVAPPGVEGISKTLTLEDGRTTTVDLDSTWLAWATSCRMASFNSPAESLARKSVTGFDTAEDDFTPWVRAERAAMASKGVTVVTYDAGRLILLDPITTERAGGGLISFEQISASVQKDNVVRKVEQALDASIVGLVPTDLADFVIDIKLIISNVLAAEISTGAIGPFRDDNGNRRAIDLTRDIIVEIDPNNPTQFFFKFFFNLRYPALRLFGEYSVDNPFFS